MSAALEMREHYRQVKARLAAAPYRPNPKPEPRTIVLAERKRGTLLVTSELIYPYPVGPSKPVRDILDVSSPGRPIEITLGSDLRGPFEQARQIRETVASICAKWGVTVEHMKSERRSREFVMARREAIYAVWKLTSWSLPRLGRMFGDRDHTTILHTIRQAQKAEKAGGQA